MPTTLGLVPVNAARPGSAVTILPSSEALERGAMMPRSASVRREVLEKSVWMLSRLSRRICNQSSLPCSIADPPCVGTLPIASAASERKRGRRTKFTTFWSAR